MPTSHESDETPLILAAQRGDIAAFGALVERHQGSIRACLAVRMNHAPDAEDLAQEALLIAFRKLPMIDPALPLGPWLRGIALHLLANHRRKFRAIPIGLNDELQAMLDTQLDAEFYPGRESERMHALRECLEELDGPARSLVRERYGDGSTLEELAARLGRKTSAISMQLHRLRSLLGDCITRRLATP